MTVLRQISATTKLSVLSAPRRPYSSAATIIAIATVIIVLLGFLSMQNGFRAVVEEAGALDTGMVMRQGATSIQASALTPDQLGALAVAPGILRTPNGQPLVSAEISVPTALKRKSESGVANLMVRGISPESHFMLRGIKLISGRTPAPGTNEMIVGRAASDEFADLGLGGSVRTAGAVWNVVGIFSADGGLYESEARADLHTVQTLFKKGATIQNARVAFRDAAGADELGRYLRERPELTMSLETEKAYFAHLSQRSGNFIQELGWPLALVMAVGALAGVGNAMYASLEARHSEIVTLRSLGFGRLAIFVAVIAESSVLALVGAAIGILLSWLLFEGARSSTIGNSLGQIVFQYHLSGRLIGNATLLAMMVGLAGSIVPAVKASRTRLAAAGLE